MRFPIVVAVIAILLASCGEDPLSGVGDIANRVVHEGTTTTLIVTADSEVDPISQPVSTRPAEELVWLNAGVSPASLDPREALTAVWERGRGVTSGFVQAGPAEITLVLPELVFPGRVPLEVQHVSSQLVFDTSAGVLDLGTSAAFGLWNTVPYSVGRSSGQMAVLSVGQSIDIDVIDDDVTSEVVADGIALTWQHLGYTYELFCRDTLAEAACWEMATSGIPLRTIEIG